MLQKNNFRNKYLPTALVLGICILLSSCGTVTELSDETYSLISLISIVATGTLIGFASVIIIYEGLKKITQTMNKKKRDKIKAKHSDSEPIEPGSVTNQHLQNEKDIHSDTAPVTINNASEEIVSINTKIKEIANVLESTDILRKEKKEIANDLKQYINGYNYSMLQDAILDLIEAYEYASHINNQLNETDSFDVKDVKGYINVISTHLEQGVKMVGIETFAPSIGNDFRTEPNTEIGKKIVVQDDSKIGKIAEIIKEGWRSKCPEDETERDIIRKSVVAVYTESE